MRENDHGQNEPIFFEKKSMRNKQKTMILEGQYKRNEKRRGTHHCCDFPKLLWF
jgi:hypothetical protein